MSKPVTVRDKGQFLSSLEERVTACRNSGLTVSKWCAQQHIAESTYYSWQKKLVAASSKSELVSNLSQEFTELKCPSAASSLQDAMPVATITTYYGTANLFATASPALAEAICRGLSHAQ